MKSSGGIRVIQALVVLALATPSPVAWAGPWLATQGAADHIGEVATVCGTVASTNFAIRSKGQPTYLNLDRPYPTQVFTILIWGNDRPKFGTPETTLLGKRVCATGTIKEYRGKPEIVATDTRQLTTQ